MDISDTLLFLRPGISLLRLMFYIIVSDGKVLPDQTAALKPKEL